jgi:hypothetical protein
MAAVRLPSNEDFGRLHSDPLSRIRPHSHQGAFI